MVSKVFGHNEKDCPRVNAEKKWIPKIVPLTQIYEKTCPKSTKIELVENSISYTKLLNVVNSAPQEDPIWFAAVVQIVQDLFGHVN